MPRFTSEQGATALEIEHLINEYWAEIDLNGGKHVEDYWCEDGQLKVGTVELNGVDELIAFYVERRELVAGGPGGIRTSRHVSANLRYYPKSADEVVVIMTVINFSGAGAPPLAGASPSILGDGKILVRRCADGEWRLKRLEVDFIFIGDDPFQNKRLLGSEKPV